MKKYVIFSSCIGGVGGGQMYVRNKLLYLRDKGWTVDVFSPHSKNIVIPELKEFVGNIVLPVFPQYYYSQKKRNRILTGLINSINDKTYEEIVIESNSINLCIWAENIASSIGAKHIAYPLGESFVISNKGIQQLLLFKYNRRELVGITDTSIMRMFESFHHIEKDKSYYLPAYCNNVEADIDSPFVQKIEKSKYDYIVGCLGRLSKNFMMPAIKDFCNYTSQQKNKKFLFLLIGDSMENRLASGEISQLLLSVKDNVEHLMTGYLYPIPTKLLEICDVFFTSAGSAWVCARSGVPTIVYDGHDLKPIGILGRTTQSCLFRKEDEPEQDFAVLMNQILFDKKYDKIAPSYNDGLPEFKDHMIFIDQSEKEKKYFDLSVLHVENKIEKTHKFFVVLFGDKIYSKFLTLKARL